MIKSYNELIKIDTFAERLKYLTLYGMVGDITFGGRRSLNQLLYHSDKWKRIRRDVIVRDQGYDLAFNNFDYMIRGPIYVHHINPITIDDLLEERSIVFDMNNLVSASFDTHNKIHYGLDKMDPLPAERTPNDTCPWK